MPRLFVDVPLAFGLETALSAGAARHVQVLRLQPGETVTLFDGSGADWSATILRIGRSEVQVRVGEAQTVDRELPLAVTLAVGMPANERMDWLVEKATELGVAAIEPLVCERSVLRLSGERAQRKQVHWQGVAIAAAEQCGRARVPRIDEPRTFRAWLEGRAAPERERRLVLSLADDRQPLQAALGSGLDGSLALLSGPEGGLSATEEAAARAAGWQAVGLGPRVLRAETAPLAVLAAVGLLISPRQIPNP